MRGAVNTPMHDCRLGNRLLSSHRRASPARQIPQLRRRLFLVFFFPAGRIKAHMTQSLSAVQAMVSESSTSSAAATHSAASSSLNGAGNGGGGASTGLVASVARRLGELRGTTLDLPTPFHAIALLVHVAMLDAGFVCTGTGQDVERSGPTAGFAPVPRPVAASQLVPSPSAFAQDGPNADGSSFFFEYQQESKQSGSRQAPLRIAVALVSVGSHVIVHSRATGGSSSGSSSGGEERQGECELSVNQYTAPFEHNIRISASSEGVQGAALDELRRLLAPLHGAEASDELRARIHSALVQPLLPAPQQKERTQASSEAPRSQPQSQPSRPLYAGDDEYGGVPRGGGFMGIPQPLTGGSRGDMDRDLYPDFSPAVPGYAIGGGRPGPMGGPGGSWVGPDHPIFGGNVGGGVPGVHGPGGFSPLPPGVPPGARFDPFGPPGTGFGIPGRGGRGGGRGGIGRGGGSGVPGFGPNPDHLPPPGNDEGPPPDMYW
jgi:hypothetical protein